jgi:hypothetical protein
MAQEIIMTVGLTTEQGKESELSRWYRDVHIPEARQHMQHLGGVTLYESMKPGQDTLSLLAIWEFDKEDAVKAIQSAIESNQTGTFTPGPKCDVKLLSFFRKIES